MPKYAFFEGQFVPIGQAKVSVMTHGLNYGTGCFEGIRAYWNEDHQQLYVFRLKEHFDRMHLSARILFIELPQSAEELSETTLELLRLEDYRHDAYIRPLAFKCDEVIGVRLHGLCDAFTMFAVPFGRYVENEEGCRVCISPWRRIDDNAAPARAKITGAYINSALAKSCAVMGGFDEALVLTASGHISEGSAENFFMVRHGKLITPPVTSNILEGITRATIMQLARDEMGVETVEREIDRSEVFVADEAFFTGTGVQVAAIIEAEYRKVGTGSIGPLTEQLRDLYFKVVRGEVEKYRHWCTPVY